MKKKLIYSVHDVKAGYMTEPRFYKTSVDAVRQFEQACKDENSQLNMYPEDYVLVSLGEFDEESGEIISWTPKTISTAAEFRKE